MSSVRNTAAVTILEQCVFVHNSGLHEWGVGATPSAYMPHNMKTPTHVFFKCIDFKDLINMFSNRNNVAIKWELNGNVYFFPLWSWHINNRHITDADIRIRKLSREIYVEKNEGPLQVRKFRRLDHFFLWLYFGIFFLHKYWFFYK